MYSNIPNKLRHIGSDLIAISHVVTTIEDSVVSRANFKHIKRVVEMITDDFLVADINESTISGRFVLSFLG